MDEFEEQLVATLASRVGEVGEVGSMPASTRRRASRRRWFTAGGIGALAAVVLMAAGAFALASNGTATRVSTTGPPTTSVAACSDGDAPQVVTAVRSFVAHAQLRGHSGHPVAEYVKASSAEIGRHTPGVSMNTTEDPQTYLIRITGAALNPAKVMMTPPPGATSPITTVEFTYSTSSHGITSLSAPGSVTDLGSLGPVGHISLEPGCLARPTSSAPPSYTNSVLPIGQAAAITTCENSPIAQHDGGLVAGFATTVGGAATADPMMTLARPGPFAGRAGTEPITLCYIDATTSDGFECPSAPGAAPYDRVLMALPASGSGFALICGTRLSMPILIPPAPDTPADDLPVELRSPLGIGVTLRPPPSGATPGPQAQARAAAEQSFGPTALNGTQGELATITDQNNAALRNHLVWAFIRIAACGDPRDQALGGPSGPYRGRTAQSDEAAKTTCIGVIITDAASGRYLMGFHGSL